MNVRYEAVSDDIVREMNDLLKESVQMSDRGFAIELERQPERWDAFLKRAGLHRGYRMIADSLSETYLATYGRPYLFTEKCMAYEIEYHADAYFWACGYRGYRRHATSMLFDRESLISHCRIIDISTDDVASRRQRLMFRYRKGVRREYRNTEADPFDRSPLAKRLLRHLGMLMRKEQ